MCLLNLKIGDRLPESQLRGIASDRRLIRDGVPASVWYPLRVRPGKEIAAIGQLERHGITAFCPMEKVRRVVRGKVIEFRKPSVTQFVYAKFQHEPLWHELQARRIITGVFCHAGRPIELPRDAIRILRGLPVAADRLRAAKEAMMRVHKGERVRITDGALAGFFAEVTEVRNGRVWWTTVFENGLPVTGESPVGSVEKIDVAKSA